MTLQRRTLRESLAYLAHAQWSGWMRYLFAASAAQPDGTVVIPKDAVDRWQRQMQASYDQLSDAEKESDRIEADRVLVVLQSQNAAPTPVAVCEHGHARRTVGCVSCVLLFGGGDHVRDEDVQSTDRISVGDRMRVSALLMRDWLEHNAGLSGDVLVKEIITEGDGTKTLVVSHVDPPSKGL